MAVLEEAAVALTEAQAAVMSKALADAERYRLESAARWCADCAARKGGACPCHLAYVAPADAYRALAAELARVTKSADRGGQTPQPASEPLPL